MLVVVVSPVSLSRYEMALVAMKSDVTRLVQELASTHTDYKSQVELLKSENRILQQRLTAAKVLFCALVRMLCCCVIPHETMLTVVLQSEVSRLSPRVITPPQPFPTTDAIRVSESENTNDSIDDVTADLDRVSRELEASKREVRTLRRQVQEEIVTVRVSWFMQFNWIALANSNSLLQTEAEVSLLSPYHKSFLSPRTIVRSPCFIIIL